MTRSCMVEDESSSEDRASDSKNLRDKASGTKCERHPGGYLWGLECVRRSSTGWTRA